MRTVFIHQPDFIPHIAFFRRLAQANVYVLLDHVQCSKSGWVHRDRIKTENGPQWLSLSLDRETREGPISEVLLSSERSWRHRHLNVLRQNYRHLAGFKEVFSEIEFIYETPFCSMMMFNLTFLQAVCGWIGIRMSYVLSSRLPHEDHRSEMNATLTKSVGGTHYLSGMGAKNYHEQAPFDKQGIEVLWDDTPDPVYPQQFGDFVPGLSILDAIFNCGTRKTRDLIAMQL